MKLLVLLFVAALSSFGSTGYAAKLRNIIQQQDSADSIQTQRVCNALRMYPRRLLCLPLPYSPLKTAGMSFNTMVKANDEAFEILSRAYDRDIDQGYVDKLFKEQNFQEASASLNVQVVYRDTAITYTPIHVFGGFKLFNPSLPVIHIAGVNESVFTIGHNLFIRPTSMQRVGEFLIAPYVSYANQVRFYGDFDLLSAAGTKPKDLITKEKSKYWDGGGGLYYYSKLWYVPTLGVRGENLISTDECNEDCRAKYIEIDDSYRRSTSLVSGFSLPLYFGNAFVGGNLAFKGIFSELADDKSSVALIYQLSKLNAYFSYSAYMRSFGFLFTSQVYRIGVQYTDEKQDDSFEIQRTKQTYIYATIYI